MFRMLLPFIFAFLSGSGSEPDGWTDRTRVLAQLATSGSVHPALPGLTAFVRAYGYVRFFHPSDEAAGVDWDWFAVDGARRFGWGAGSRTAGRAGAARVRLASVSTGSGAFPARAGGVWKSSGSLRISRRSGSGPPSSPGPTCISGSGFAGRPTCPSAGSAVRLHESDPLDGIVREFAGQHEVPGLAVAIVAPHGERFIEVGVRSRVNGEPVDRRTAFEIGSVTKVFAGLLLAEMALRGEIGLDDGLPEYLDGPAAANPALAGVQVHQLATHTSGLPRLPPDLQPADLADPYGEYTPEHLEATLADITLAREPGEAYEYSNLGGGLVGHLLARRAGSPFPQLLEERLLEPLGLGDSFVPAATEAAGDRDAGPAVARGHSASGEVPPWRFDALAGAGAMWSTAADLARFLQRQLDPPADELGEAIRLSQEIHAEGPGTLRLALGWHVIELPKVGAVYFHNGGTGGFRSFVAFAPSAEIGVAVLMNRDAPLHQVDRLGVQLLQTLAGDGPRP